MNYRIYRLSPREAAGCFFTYIFFDLLISYLFYDSFITFFILFPGIFIFIKGRRRELLNRQKRELKKEFQDMLLSAATALNAGYSIENSFKEAYRDMSSLYGESSLGCMELKSIIKKLDIGIPLEEILKNFAERADIEEIGDFAEIFSMAKRNGGDFKGIIEDTVDIMREKEETEREIEVMLSGKSFEQKIMSIIPLFIILYLKLSTRGFLNVLYHNTAGIVVMSICLMLYAFSFLLSKKIAAIEV